MAEHEPQTNDEGGAATASYRSDAARQPGKKRSWPRVLAIAVAALVVIAGALAGLFAWDRWYRYDDAADFQGHWYPAGSTAAIVIDESVMVFDDETKYSYELDTHAKTVTYAIGNVAGAGHYWFADDRNTLIIEDGDGFDALGTALDDLARIWAGLNAAVDGRPLAPSEGDGFATLTRTPDQAAVEAKARAEAEAAEESDEPEEPEEPEEEQQEFSNESMGFL